jgi:ribosome-associated protein
MAPGFKAVSVAAARAAWDKKAEDVLLLHVAKTSPLTDYLLLATALSTPQMESIEHEIVKALKEFSLPCLRRAKPESANWRILDYGGLIVHVMSQETRQFYALEKLHPEAPKIKWQPSAARIGS